MPKQIQYWFLDYSTLFPTGYHPFTDDTPGTGHHAAILFQTIPAEPTGNTTPVTDSKIDQLISAPQDISNKQKALNQDDSKRAKPEFSIKSSGFQSCTNPKQVTQIRLKCSVGTETPLKCAALRWDIESVLRKDWV